MVDNQPSRARCQLSTLISIVISIGVSAEQSSLFPAHLANSASAAKWAPLVLTECLPNSHEVGRLGGGRKIGHGPCMA